MWMFVSSRAQRFTRNYTFLATGSPMSVRRISLAQPSSRIRKYWSPFPRMIRGLSTWLRCSVSTGIKRQFSMIPFLMHTEKCMTLTKGLTIRYRHWTRRLSNLWGMFDSRILIAARSSSRRKTYLSTATARFTKKPFPRSRRFAMHILLRAREKCQKRACRSGWRLIPSSASFVITLRRARSGRKPLLAGDPPGRLICRMRWINGIRRHGLTWN